MRLLGKAHKFGDDINTDLIISGRYKFKTMDGDELARHLMEDIRPKFRQQISPGDFIVAGKNFGCGSSREQAPLAIKKAGISGVIAKSFARIFFRNSINIGLPLLECKETDLIEEGEELEVNLGDGIIRNRKKNLEFGVKPLPKIMLEILRSQGLVEYFKRHKGFKSEG
jgi:3-isopropylmalate/(R)-2-methylmalate dehydratase small subunit